MSFLKKLWGKTKTDDGDATEHSQPKEENFFKISFENHENPQKSFILDSSDPQNVYFMGQSGEKFTSFSEDSKTKFIMKPDQWQKNLQNGKRFNSEQSYLNNSKTSLVLHSPTVFNWKNKEAYIYQVETSPAKDGETPDLEFVIYIPIDTAVTWLSSPYDNTQDPTSEQGKSPDYLTETDPDGDKAVNRASTRGIKHASEVIGPDKKYTMVTWNNDQYPFTDQTNERPPAKQNNTVVQYALEEHESNIKHSVTEWKNYGSLSYSSDMDEDDNEKPEPVRNKVKGKKKVKKKAGRIVTMYEDDGDEISLGRLRPQEEKKPVKIVERDKLF